MATCGDDGAPTLGMLLFVGSLICCGISIAAGCGSFGLSIFIICGATVCTFTTGGRCPLVGSTIWRAPPPPPPPMALGAGMVRGIYGRKVMGVMIWAFCTTTWVCAVSVNQSTAEMMTTCMMKEMVLEV